MSPVAGLNSENSYINPFISAPSLGCSLGNAEKIAAGGRAGVCLLIEFPYFINVCSLCVDVGKLPCERSVPVVSHFLQRCGLDLAHNPDFVACSH